MQVTALRDSQSVSKLTRMGILFLPASCIAGLMSMGGAYLPGESRFWVYWVIAVPVVGAALFFDEKQVSQSEAVLTPPVLLLLLLA